MHGTRLFHFGGSPLLRLPERDGEDRPKKKTQLQADSSRARWGETGAVNAGWIDVSFADYTCLFSFSSNSFVSLLTFVTSPGKPVGHALRSPRPMRRRPICSVEWDASSTASLVGEHTRKRDLQWREKRPVLADQL